MIRILLVVALFLAVEAVAAPEAFIVNGLAETLSKINLETGAVQNHIAVLGDTPNQVEYYNGYLYVINSVSADMQKINPINNQTVANIPFVVGSNPYSVAFDGNYAFVSGWASGLIYRVNLGTNEVDNQIQIGGFPEGLAVSGGSLFAAQTAFNPVDFSYGQGRMARINPLDMTLEEEIDIGKNPQSFVEISDTILHVVCTGDYGNVGGAIYIFNTRNYVVVDSLLIGGQPVNGAMAPGHIVFLAAGGWESHGIILVYNADTRQIINGVSNPIVGGLGATDVAVDSLGYVYTCNFGDDTVSKISREGPPFPPYAVGDGPQSIVVLDTRTTDISEEDVDLPNRAILLGNYPNPFNSQTVIKYDLAGTSGGEIELFDIRGGLITRIPLEDGTTSTIWDGANHRGDYCAAGIYFARLIVGSSDERSSGIMGNAIAIIYVK